MSFVQVEVVGLDQQKNIEFVVKYAQIQNKVRVQQGNKLVLRTGPGEQDTLTGLNTICRYLAELSDKQAELLGGDVATKAQISNHLLTRMYLVHNTPSLADLCLFCTLHQALTTELAKPKTSDPVKGKPDAKEISDKPSVSSNISGAPATTRNSSQAAAESTTPANNSTSAAKTPPADPSTSGNDATKPDGEKDEKQAKKDARKEARKAAEPKKVEEARIDMLDIRVGKIVEVGPHPSADTLYVEQIDLGEDKPRQVVSGLKNHVSVEKMQDRRVVVCTNLKPAKMRDVMSFGMVLCASSATHDKVDPLLPPEAAALGARIEVAGYSNEPLAEINPKKKILEKLKEDLHTDSVGLATYKSVPFMVSGPNGGPVTSKIPSGHVG